MEEREMPSAATTAEKSKTASQISLRLILGILLSLASVGIFGFVWEAVEGRKLGATTFDRTILTWLHAHQVPWLLPIAKGLAFLGSPPTIVSIAVIGVVLGLVWRKVRGAAWTLPIAVVGAGIIIQGMKLEFHRPRPTLFAPLLHETGKSFPSGHSLIAVVVYGLLGYFALHLVNRPAARRAVLVATILLIVAIGVSRPYVQVHYPTDVLGGWMAGIPWLLTCLGVHEILTRRYANAGEPVLQAPGKGDPNKPLGVSLPGSP